MTNAEFFDYMFLFGLAVTCGALIFFSWPRYAYRNYPNGKYELRDDDCKAGWFGIWMKVGTFRGFGYLYVLVVGMLTILIKVVPLTPPTT